MGDRIIAALLYFFMDILPFVAMLAIAFFLWVLFISFQEDVVPYLHEKAEEEPCEEIVYKEETQAERLRCLFKPCDDD